MSSTRLEPYAQRPVQVLSHRTQPRGKHRKGKNPVAKQWYPHIPGLRGLSIALVVIFHVFVGKVSSGVDVFLFVGGLLVLKSQLKNADEVSGMSFLQSLLRIIRRLYPVLLTVVAVTSVLYLFFFPKLWWEGTLEEGSAAVTYWINWLLISTDQSYAAAGSSDKVSIYQHLWSMSAQLQIYLLIIGLIYLISRLCQRFSRDSEHLRNTITLWVMVALTVASFGYATWMFLQGRTHENYYSTFSRFWEIGLGSVLGYAVIARVVFPAIVRRISAVVGLCMIASVGLFLNGTEQFPGPWTLIPIVGAFLVIVAGNTYPNEKHNWSTVGVVSVLETKPFEWLGKISYSLYLWHWPLLVMALHVFVEEDSSAWVRPVVGIGVIAVSLILAGFTNKFIEIPLQQRNKPSRVNTMFILTGQYFSNIMRRSPSPGLLITALTYMVVAAVVISSPVMLRGYDSYQIRALENKAEDMGGMDKVYPGAKTISEGISAPDGIDLYPPVGDLDSMMPPTTVSGCFSSFGGTDIVLEDKNGKPCQYGDVESSQTLYVVGGSHSEMFIPALDEIGKKRHFKIIPIIKMGCALFQETRWNGDDFPECYRDWSLKVMDYILKNPPTMGVFHTSTRPTTINGNGPEHVPEAYEQAMKKFADAGIHVWLMRDVPWHTLGPTGGVRDVRYCLSVGYTIEQCSQPANWSLYAVNPALTHYKDIPADKITHLDIDQYVIKDGATMPVIGNVVAYRDSHHLTKQFVITMTDILDKQMFGGASAQPAVSLGGEPAAQATVQGQQTPEDTQQPKRQHQQPGVGAPPEGMMWVTSTVMVPAGQ